MSKLSKYLVSSSLLWVCNLALPSVALGEGIQETDLNSSETVATALPTETKLDAAAPVVESKTFVSDGSTTVIENLGITIAPPAGWQVATNGGSLSVVMKEPREEAPSYDKPKYQRNITIAAIHKSSPIDEVRAKELKEELTKSFSSDSMVSEFSILEHKFFDYRGKNDGLLIYSNLNIGEYPMMQMHILISGSEKQFLLSYTDLADRFSDATNGFYEKAWASMVSTEVTGQAPNRMEEYYKYGAFAGGCLMFGLVGYLFRRKAAKHDFSSDADALMDAAEEPSVSMISTLAHGWKIKSDDDFGSDDFGMSFHGEEKITKIESRTRKTEKFEESKNDSQEDDLFVSNF